MTSHQYIIDKEKNNKDSENLSDVSRMLVKFSILEVSLISLLLMQQILKDQMGKINDLEKKDFRSIKKIEDKILKIKLSIDKSK